VVSAGGYPKDLNMYQAQKALDNAGHAVREGGIIIWIASCREELGEKTFEKWMKSHDRSEDMITDIRLNFELGGHKAAAIAMVLKKARILLVSELDPEFVRSLHLEPCATVQEALERAIQSAGEGAKILAMPYGGSTLPIVAGK
jgi:nickel-dependent lactate racemase